MKCINFKGFAKIATNFYDKTFENSNQCILFSHYSISGKSSIVICCELNSVMMNTGRYEFVDCIKLALFGDGCSAAVLTAEDVKPGDNKWVVEGNQHFSNQTSITAKET